MSLILLSRCSFLLLLDSGANAYAGDDAVAAGDDAVATDDAAYADEAGEEAAGDDVAYADEDEEEAAGDDAEEEAQDDEQAEEAERTQKIITKTTYKRRATKIRIRRKRLKKRERTASSNNRLIVLSAILCSALTKMPTTIRWQIKRLIGT